MTFYLITTDHLETQLWFRDDEDFRVGMNYVAVVAFLLDIDVLAFILMSNHVHFVLACSEEEAWRFITEFKRLFSHYLSRKYQTRESLRRNGVEGNCFFRTTADKGRPLGGFSYRSLTRLLHTKQDLPEGWLLGDGGYILPGSYVNKDFVENLFRTPKRMSFFLQNSSKARRRLELKETDLPSFRDQLILSAMADLCQSLFHQRDIRDLDAEQQGVLISQIRRRFSADANQIARVTGIPYREIARMLQGF